MTPTAQRVASIAAALVLAYGVVVLTGRHTGCWRCRSLRAERDAGHLDSARPGGAPRRGSVLTAGRAFRACARQTHGEAEPSG